MQQKTNLLIDELLLMLEKSTQQAKTFLNLSPEILNYKPAPNQWSILECIEHLNLYGDYYLPEIERRIIESSQASANSIFKSGLIGNYFANLMLVKNGSIKKMKTPKDKDPQNSQLNSTTIERFLKQQEKLTNLLNKARTSDLTNIKCSISLSKWIKLRLGDTFRFLIFHIDRHLKQAENVKINWLERKTEN
jgi:hypothetical protein